MVRLIDHLRDLGMSGRDARRALEFGKVFLGLVPTADATRDVDPSAVTVRLDAPRIRVGKDISVVFRDPHLAVIYKPAGLLSVPAPSRKRENNALKLAGQVLKRALTVHRLDEHTSGLMMVARTEQCQQALKALLEVHDIERSYLALVHGAFPAAPTIVRNQLVRDRGDGLRGSGPSGREAVTRFALRARAGSASLVEARLETGRTHQVRIHLSELGFPVLADRLYGPRRPAPVRRLALHSYRLALRHPITRAQLTFEVPLADDLERARRVLAQGPTRGDRPSRKGRKRR